MTKLFRKNSTVKNLPEDGYSFDKIENILATLGLLDVLIEYKTAFSVYDQRDIYLTLKEVFSDFKKLYITESLDEDLLNPLLKEFGFIDKNAKTKLNKVQVPTFNILEIKPEELDKQTLKRAFRKASLTHHPDKGGDESKMKKAIDEYVLLEKYLMTQSLFERTDESSDLFFGNELKNVENFYNYARTKVFKASVDIWDLNYSTSLFDEIVNSDFKLLTTSILFEQVFIVSGDLKYFRRVDLIENESYKTYLKRYIEFITNFEGRKYIYDEFSTKDSVDEDIAWHLDMLERRKVVFGKTLRKVFTHPLQLNFAKENNIIDNEYYESKMRTFGELEKRDKELNQSIADYSTNPGFFVFDHELDFTNSENHKGNFEFAYLFEQLKQSKKIEYSEAFYEKPTLSLVRDYLHIRLNSIIENLLIKGEFSNKERLVIELEFLSTLKRMNSRKQIYDEINDCINLLIEGDLAKEQKKLSQKVLEFKEKNKEFSIDGSTMSVTGAPLSYSHLLLYR